MGKWGCAVSGCSVVKVRGGVRGYSSRPFQQQGSWLLAAGEGRRGLPGWLIGILFSDTRDLPKEVRSRPGPEWRLAEAKRDSDFGLSRCHAFCSLCLAHSNPCLVGQTNVGHSP